VMGSQEGREAKRGEEARAAVRSQTRDEKCERGTDLYGRGKKGEQSCAPKKMSR